MSVRISRIISTFLARQAASQSFEDWLSGKTFRNPDTGNKVKFHSLPSAEQSRVRGHWNEAQNDDEEKDGKDSTTEHLDKYKLSIISGNKQRAEYVAKKIQEGISASADFCQESPPSCEGNLGIPRSSMPQVMDVSVKKLLESSDAAERKKGKAAVEAGADPESDKSILDDLLDTMKKKGVSVTREEVPVGKLKATQKEIKAGKSFGMADQYYQGKFDPSQDVEIIISSDNHILDGHHRWAALLLADPTKTMKVVKVDMTMREFLKASLKHPGVFRADLQDNIIDKDAPLEGYEGGDKEDKENSKKARRIAQQYALRTAGEVRFIRDRSGDQDENNWAWNPSSAVGEEGKRAIDPDYKFSAKNLKPLAKALRAALMALGHAQSASATLNKIKSQTVSPDGNLGGRGYVMPIKDMRRNLMNCCEALSSITDTIYDEINAIHWHPDVQDSGGDPRARAEIQEIMDDVEEIKEDPEEWAEAEEQEGVTASLLSHASRVANLYRRNT